MKSPSLHTAFSRLNMPFLCRFNFIIEEWPVRIESQSSSPKSIYNLQFLCVFMVREEEARVGCVFDLPSNQFFFALVAATGNVN